MRRTLAILALLLGCGTDLRPPDGVYTLCREVAGYSGETLELKDGRFRYWFYSDVVTGKEPAFPLTGEYRISGDTLTLIHPQVYEPTRTIAKVGDTWVLWRDDALKVWKKERRLHSYGILLRVEAAEGDVAPNRRPTLALLETPEMKERDRKEYEGRFMDRPEPSRSLLRARSRYDDPNLAAYVAAVTRARYPLDPRLPAQLIGLMGGDSSAAIEAGFILEDLYQQTELIQEPPPAASRKKTLEILIDSLADAPDRYALQNAIILYLRVSEIGKMDLAVSGTGLRIKLQALPSGYSTDSEGTPDDDIRWLKLMPMLIPVCQAWMRAQLPK